MSVYTTLPNLKAFLSITDTSEDVLLSLLISQVSAAMEEYLDRNDLGQQTYTEILCGNGRAFVTVRNRPVTSIASLYLDELAYWGEAPDAFASGTLLTQGVDYALDVDQADGSSRSGMIFNINGWWPQPINYDPGIISPTFGPNVGNIKVTYTAGYASIPGSIALACNLACAAVRNGSQYGQALASENYEDYGVSLPTDAARHLFPPEVRSLLSRYRNVAVA